MRPHVVKAACARVGLDAAKYSGHSLRAGCATAWSASPVATIAQPQPQRTRRTTHTARPAVHADLAPHARLTGLAPAQTNHQALPHLVDVGQLQRGQLAPPQHQGRRSGKSPVTLHQRLRPKPLVIAFEPRGCVPSISSNVDPGICRLAYPARKFR